MQGLHKILSILTLLQFFLQVSLAGTGDLPVEYTIDQDEDGIVDALDKYPTDQTNKGLGTVIVSTWDDVDGNGKQTKNEPIAQNIQVQLTDNFNNELRPYLTVDNYTGQAVFFDIPLNTAIKIATRIPSRYAYTSIHKGWESNYDSDIYDGDGRSNVHYISKLTPYKKLGVGVLSPAIIQTYVWEDKDIDGGQDEIKTGIPNIKVHLFTAEDEHIKTTATDGKGLATFYDVPAKTKVYLKYDVPNGSAPTGKWKFWDTRKDSDIDEISHTTGTFYSSKGGELISDYDAGFILPGEIKAFVWDDTDGDRAQDAGEHGIPNVKATLFLKDGTPLANSWSNEEGFVHFNNVPSKTHFYIQFFTPNNYILATGKKYWNTEINSDANNKGITGYYRTEKSKEVITEIGCAFWGNHSVETFVWDDLNANGVQDENEPGVKGVKVQLLSSNGSKVFDENWTDEHGTIKLNNLPPDTYCKLKYEGLPENYGFTKKRSYWHDGLDSDVDQNTGETPLFKSNGGGTQTIVKQDCGLWGPSFVEVYVWNDIDGEGDQDEDEKGIPNIHVQLFSETGNELLSEGSTDYKGYITLNKVPIGERVKIVVNKPQGYSFTYKKKYWNTLEDSDVDQLSGESYYFKTNYGYDTITRIDAGMWFYKANGTVNSMAFVDENNNGGLDINEEGLAGVKVNLYNENNTIIRSAYTDDNGEISFSKLDCETYYRMQYLPNELGNYVFTSKSNYWSTTRDNDVEPKTGYTNWFKIDVLERERNDIKAGFIAPCTINTFVWLDEDGNSAKDDNELGVEKIKVNLLTKEGQLIDYKYTNEQGVVSFPNIESGIYYYLKYEDLPKNYVFVHKKTFWNDKYDSDVAPSKGTSDYFKIPKGLTEINTYNAGIWAPTKVETYVWNDANANGRQDENESPFEDILVSLYSSKDELLSSSTTNEKGIALLDNLEVGQFAYLRYHLPDDNHSFTYRKKYWYTFEDSDADMYTGKTYTFKNKGGELRVDYDAGIWTPGKIISKVWNDTNKNGVQDDTEEGIGNYKVHLCDNKHNILATQYTNSVGDVLFENVPVNTHVHLYYPKLDEISYTLKNKGTNDEIDSDVDRNNYRTANITFYGSFQEELNTDAGLYYKSSTQSSSKSSTFSIDYKQKVELQTALNTLKIGPTYTTSNITLFAQDLDAERFKLQIIDLNGRVLWNKHNITFTGSNYYQQLPSLSNGQYLLVITLEKYDLRTVRTFIKK